MIKYLFALLLLTGCGKPITEKGSNNYRNALLSGVSEEIFLDTSMSLNFDLLPLKGEVKRNGKLWSGDSWRLKFGAINYRWNAKIKEGFTYLSPGPREILTLPRDRIKELSPSEKFDLYVGNYEYPLRWEVDTLARKGTESWEGLCHGWAGASLNHEEPGPKTVTNPDGIDIYFGSADIKALLSYAYSKILIERSDFLGNSDLTPLSFHAAVTNLIGLRGKSVIVDIDPSAQVWNHPIVSFETTVLSMRSTKRGKIAIVSTKIKYVDVVEQNLWEKGNADMMGYMTLKYKITMDEQGNMESSEWLSYERPDFLWTVKETNFAGQFAKLKNLLK